MEYYKKNYKPNHKKRYTRDDHDHYCCRNEEYDHHQEKKISRTVADFDYFNQAGSVVLNSLTTAPSVEEIIGTVRFEEVFNGDLVHLRGSSTVTAGATLPSTITFRIHKVRKLQHNPLLSPTIYTRTVSVTANTAFAVTLEFVDVLINDEDEVNYYYTVSIPAGVTATATVSNSTHTGALHR